MDKRFYKTNILLELLIDIIGVTPIKENYRSYIYNCPVCKSKEKLYIDKRSGRAICFRQKDIDCPTSSTALIDVVCALTEEPLESVESKYFDILKERKWNNFKSNFSSSEDLESLDGLKIEDNDFNVFKYLDTPKAKPTTPQLDAIQIPHDFYPLHSPEAMLGAEYLATRGLNINALAKYDIRFSPTLNRVIFPVIMDGKWVGWQARTIYKNVEPRMLNLAGEWKSKSVMFYDNVLRSDFVIIAEGAVSALKWEKVGSFVATMGKTVSQTQLHLILKGHIKEVYLAFDPDAYADADKIAERIRRINPKVKIFWLPVPKGKEDFGDCSYDECVDVFYSDAIEISRTNMALVAHDFLKN